MEGQWEGQWEGRVSTLSLSIRSVSDGSQYSPRPPAAPPLQQRHPNSTAATPHRNTGSARAFIFSVENAVGTDSRAMLLKVVTTDSYSTSMSAQLAFRCQELHNTKAGPGGQLVRCNCGGNCKV